MRIKYYLLSLMLLISIFSVYGQSAAPFNSVYSGRVKGDILQIGNNILSFHRSNVYNGNDTNADQDMVYVDIDGDASTFNSSSGILQVPNTSRDCYKIKYAALYWSATYTDANRANINRVKFKVPGSSTYVNLTGTVIYDEFASNILTASNHVPYAAFADVTSLINATSAEGTYTIADITASTGSAGTTGLSGGWSLFLVYEDSRLSAKYITTFNGFTGISSSLPPQEIDVTGFQTIPTGNVRSKVAFAALEGDKNIKNDFMEIRGVNTNPLFTGFSPSPRNANNVFDSSISDVNGNYINRTPASQNTLGYDAAVDFITGPPNSVIGNGETAAKIRIDTDQDTYDIFFVAFQTEIIEPDILLTKDVRNLAGQPIGNTNVSLCQELNYVISFDNIGNDDAEGTTANPAPYGTDYVLIRDILPINTTLVSYDVTNIPGTVVVPNPGNPRDLSIYVPKSFFTVNEVRHQIVLRVRIACSCAELTTACSNLIQNQAFITYQGVISDILISSDPSSSTYNLACSSGNADATNFLIGLDTCTFNTDVFICGTSVTLTAGAGYDNYVWTGPVGATFVPNNTSQVVTVNMPGLYTVNGTDALCRPIRQTFNVIQYGASLTNPIIPYDESPIPVICTDNGERLPYIFLCGAGDSQLLQTNITDATSVQWFLYNQSLPGCGPYPATNCPVTTDSCWTNQVGTGSNYTVTQAGFYRVVFTFPGGCNRTFYFNAYQNLLDPQVVAQNIICGIPGSITVNNVPTTGYEFQLLNGATVVFPWQSSNVFTPIGTAGTYTVQVRPTAFSGGCIFTIPNIGIQSLIADVTANVTEPLCFGDKGSVNIAITGVPGPYFFVLHEGLTVASPVVGNVGPTNTGFNIFSGLTPGQTYTWEVWSEVNGLPRKCYTSQTFTLLNPTLLNVSSSITRPFTTCGDGEITVTTTGGTQPYYYYLNTAPPTPFTATGLSPYVIPVNASGTYTILVIDSNGCRGTTQQVITQQPAPVYSVSHTDIICASSPNAGTITFTVTNANGNALMYSIDGGVTYHASPFFTNLPAGTYTPVIQFTIGTAVCTNTFAQQVIDAANPLSATASVTTPYTCTTNGEITVTVTSNGAGGLQYSIDGGTTWQASPVFSGLTAGTYTIIVRDANGCTFTITPNIVLVPLTPPTDLSFTATALTCPTNVSTVTVTGTGGTTPLTYQITAPAAFVSSNGTGIFTNLPPNTYTFLVTDAKNCTYTETYTIAPLAPFTVTPSVVSNVVCFGTSTGVIRFTVAGYAPTYNYTVTGPGGYSQSATGVSASTITLPAGPAGTYTITVTNPITNCQDVKTIDILGPSAALTATLVPTEVTCTSLGTLTVNASNGWGGYVYTIAPSAGITLSGNVFSNIPASATPYVVTITDANGCAITRSYTFNAPTNPTLALSVAPVSDFCFDSGNQATLVVTASNGIAPYSFSINGGAYVPSNTPVNSHTFTNLTPGPYTISVRDAFGCTNSVVFNQTINPQLIVNTILTKGFDCTGTPNATIEGTISNGYPAYQEYWVSYNGGAYVSLGAPTGATFTYSIPTTNPGTYQFQVRDLRGCIAFSNVITIGALSIPDLTATTSTPMLSCFGDSTGVINFNITGGNPAFTVTVVNTTTGVNYGSQTTGLPAGNYTVTVVDSKSCTDVVTDIIIGQPAQLFYTTTVNPITCNIVGTTYNPGSICVNTDLVGGTLPITFTLTNSLGAPVGAPIVVNTLPLASTVCFPNIDFGVYTVTAVDNNGCARVIPNLIMSSPPSGLTFTFTGAATCAAGATLQVDISGGVIGPGTYQFGIVDLSAAPWSSTLVNSNNGPASHIFTGLIPGATYTIVVYDTTTGCYHFENAPTVPTSINPTITHTENNVTCRGAADGNIQFSLAGLSAGVTQFSYQLIDAATNLNIGVPVVINAPFIFPYTVGPLAPGSYSLLIRELNGANAGCGITFGPYTISQSATVFNLFASSTPDNCNANAGVITAVASGGTGPYLYQLFSDTGVVGVLDGTDPLPTDLTFSATFISPTHIPNFFNRESGDYIVYAKDAFGCIREFFISIALDPTPVVAAAVVNACAAQGGFAINVTLPTAGIAPYSFSIDGGAYQVMVPPFTISGLSSGAHTVQVRDKNGCGNLVNVTILDPLIASAAFTIQPICNAANGEITVTATGGTGSYTYTLGAVTNATGIFPGMAPGTYTITVTDINMNPPVGCSTTATVTLANAIVPSFTLSQTGVKCAGDANGSITVTLLAGNTDVPYRYRIIAGPVTRPFQNSPIFANLPTGLYTIEVESGRLCFNTDQITVTTPLALTGSAFFPPLYSCTNNVIDPVIVTINETLGTGTGPYTYSINGGGYFTTNTFPIIASTTGTTPFTFSIKDANGCIFNGNGVIPQVILLNAAVAQSQRIDCFNGAEIVTITAMGGSGNYSYVSLPQPGGAANVIAGPGVNQFTITAPGTYYFRVIDTVTGCWFDTAAYDVAVFNNAVVTANATGVVRCFGETNGALSFTVTGYTGAFTYDILDSTSLSVASGGGTAPTATPIIVSTLGVGTYTVQITESVYPRCIVTSNQVTILGPTTALTLLASEQANVTCDNDKGVIVATASGGWGTYTYSISPNNGTQTSPGVFEGLSGTTNYIITVADAQGCPVTDNVTLTRPLTIDFDPILDVQLTCFGVNDGSVTVTNVINGANVTNDYNYTLNFISPAGTSSGPQPSPTFSNLGPGTYSITVNDPYNCPFTRSFTVLPANQVFVTLATVPNTQVCDTSFEQLVLTASGGTGTFEYSTSPGGPWTPFVSPFNLGSFPAGPHTYYVHDSNNCAAVASNTVTIQTVPTLGLNPIANIQLDCSYFNTTITAQAFGGEGGYIYSINPAIAPPNTTGVFANVPVNNYTITVSSDDCRVATRDVSVTSPLPFDYTIQPFNTSCSYTNDGSLVVTLIGVDGREIQYSLQSSDGIYTHAQAFDVFDEASGTFTVNNLAGNVDYEIFVFTLPSGCTPGPKPFRINRPAAINATINVANEQCSEDNIGELIITNITGGTNAPSSAAPIYTVSYTSNSAVTPSGTITLPLGTNFHTFGGLDGGDYVITINDTNGCEFTFNRTILPGDDYDAVAVVTYPCVNNQPAVRIEVLNMRATSPYRFATAYQFSLDGLPNVASNPNLDHIFTSADYPSLLTAGNHTIYVYGPSNCDKIATPDPLVVTPLTPVSVYLVTPQPVINTATAIASGGSGNFTYTFYADGQLVQSGSSNTYVYLRQYNEIRVVVTDDSGCTFEDAEYLPYIPICIPDVLTPDGNGQNDDWGPGCVDPTVYPNLVTRIYDRYGRLIATLKVGERWNGLYEGKELPSGDYWYVLKVDKNNGKEYVGHFTLYR